MTLVARGLCTGNCGVKGRIPMKYLVMILLIGVGAACTAKNEAAPDREAPARRSPGPIAPDSRLLNPPNQQVR
jgi:hypothetical protein